MIRKRLYATLTGFHLAFLQFSYFLILQINVSSTYITYMVVVISWMLGAVAGLWMHRLRLEVGIALGVVSYYAVYYLILWDPLARTTLMLSALGVGLSGLWAGRFFTAMLPHLRRVDALFFHENNGFLVGVVAVFVGFTTLGRDFLFWTPLALTILLLPGTRLFPTRQ